LEAHNLHWYNPHMHKQSLFPVFRLLLLGFLLSACAQGITTDEQAPTGTFEGTLRPYPTERPTTSPSPTYSATPLRSPTASPTPTPVIYEVQEGDDMYGIAFFYNISPQALMTANPTVIPNAMGPGTKLVIPITPAPETTPTATNDISPTSTLTFSTLPAPDCYPDALGGLWCFVLVANDEAGALENVTGVIELQQGEAVQQEIALTPLNLIPAGKSLPLVAYFQPPVNEEFRVSASVDFFLPVLQDDNRYLPVNIVEQTLTIDEDGMTAQISGEFSFPEGQPDAAYVWISATAFDREGHIVAVRRWENEQTIGNGDQNPFVFALYSLGEPIGRVDLLVEAYREQTAQE